MLTAINHYAVPADRVKDVWEHETQIGRESFTVASDAFTVIMSRSVRESVDLCSRLAIDLTRTGRPALLVNTFATRERLVMSLESARSEDLPLMIEEVPIGEWDTSKVEEWAKGCGAQAIFINSFEFAALTQWQKGQVASALLKMQRRTGLAIVLFTHRIEHTMIAGDVGRGPLGCITPFAVQVVQLGAFRPLTNKQRAASQPASDQSTGASQSAAASQSATASQSAGPAPAASRPAVNEKAIEVRESERARTHSPSIDTGNSGFVVSKPGAARRTAASGLVGT